MAFEFKLQATSTTDEGQFLSVADISDWSLADLGDRAQYGIFLTGEFRTSDTPDDVSIVATDPLVAALWSVATPLNGRYSITAHAFLIIGNTQGAPSVDDVQVDTADGLLYQWDGAAWNLVELADVLAKAYYTSVILEVPMLGYAYTYKNSLNLEYIKRVKYDIDHGVSQDKLYYSRTDLDYLSALILGAEYNWAIVAYDNYYQLVLNIDKIIETGKLS